jgi:hypothetical protein
VGELEDFLGRGVEDVEGGGDVEAEYFPCSRVLVYSGLDFMARIHCSILCETDRRNEKPGNY